VAITDISKVGDLFLYDCENGVCQRTDGFVKYGESLANTASCSTGSKCAVAAADLTITGIAVIDYTDFKFYDISDTSKETVKYTVAVNKEYFYKKDNNNFVLIKTANDGESSLMIIGVAKFSKLYSVFFFFFFFFFFHLNYPYLTFIIILFFSKWITNKMFFFFYYYL